MDVERAGEALRGSVSTDPARPAAAPRAVSMAILVAALGYFVDIYDLILFGIVRVASLRSDRRRRRRPAARPASCCSTCRWAACWSAASCGASSATSAAACRCCSARSPCTRSPTSPTASCTRVEGYAALRLDRRHRPRRRARRRHHAGQRAHGPRDARLRHDASSRASASSARVVAALVGDSVRLAHRVLRRRRPRPRAAAAAHRRLRVRHVRAAEGAAARARGNFFEPVHEPRPRAALPVRDPDRRPDLVRDRRS